MGVPISRVNDKIIEEHITAKNLDFFSGNYLDFLFNPEEAGASFIVYTAGGTKDDCQGVINQGLLNNINLIMQDISTSVKLEVASRVDNLMVSFYLTIENIRM